jgi:hypothetical protein
MTYILRLENKDGKGAFFGQSLYKASKGLSNFDPRGTMSPPTGHGERNGSRCSTVFNLFYKCYYNTDDTDNSKYFFGMENEEKYLKWMKFKRARKNISNEGMLLKVYKVPKKYVVYGYQQLVFVKEYSECVYELKPDYIDIGEKIPERFRLS